MLSMSYRSDRIFCRSLTHVHSQVPVLDLVCSAGFWALNLAELAQELGDLGETPRSNAQQRPLVPQGLLTLLHRCLLLSLCESNTAARCTFAMEKEKKKGTAS
jgi:hypothetical protein